MNVEYVETFSNHQYINNVIRRNIFHETTFYKLGTSSLHSFLFFVILRARITCVTVKYLILYITLGFTVPLGLVEIYVWI